MVDRLSFFKQPNIKWFQFLKCEDSLFLSVLWDWLNLFLDCCSDNLITSPWILGTHNELQILKEQ